MAAEICLDSFFINLFGNLLCTFRLKDRTAVRASYGTVTYSKVFLYAIGTGTDPTHANYGFWHIYDPVPGASNFPPGVTLTEGFDDTPDLSDNPTEVKEGTFTGTVTINRNTYPGSSDDRYVRRVLVTIGFNIYLYRNTLNYSIK